jgi:uncharacterized protein YggL (DUF469 family)
MVDYKYTKMTTILLSLSEAVIGRQIDHVVESNISRLSESERIFINDLVNDCKKRIKRVNNEKRKSYKLLLN